MKIAQLSLFLVGHFLLAGIPKGPAWAVNVVSDGPVTSVSGQQPIKPAPGTQGASPDYNSYFYIVPGQGEGPVVGHPDQRLPPVDPFFRAYSNAKLPVQTNDWWTGVGLQYPDWVNGRASVKTSRTLGFTNAPFYLAFTDYITPFDGQPDYPAAIHGLTLWNQNSIYVNTTGKVLKDGKPTPGFNAQLNSANRASLAPYNQPVVTVGLQDVHPILVSDGNNGWQVPPKQPWTSIRVDGYSDWSARMSYGDANSRMRIDTADGSPFVWFQRTKGTAPFVVWAGSPANSLNADLKIWQESGTDLGLTVTTAFNPSNATSTDQYNSTAAYGIYADQGTWQKKLSADGKIVTYVNPQATYVAVLGLPHNIAFETSRLMAALTTFKPFACRRIAGTQLDYPPIPGSATSVKIGSTTLPLGYSAQDATLRYQLRQTNQALAFPGCKAGNSVQMLFPHHQAQLDPRQKNRQMLVNPGTNEPYRWNTMKGPVLARQGKNLVLSLRTPGMLPFMPAVLAGSDLKNPLDNNNGLAVEDVYATLRDWFYKNMETGGQPDDSFVRNLGTYDNIGYNTYEQAFSTLIETLSIADQLARSPKLQGQQDTSSNVVKNATVCLCKDKTQVAAEIRDYLLQTLKELVSQWGDIYSAQLFQSDPGFDSTYGHPAGYFAVQNLNDHHFHYGYFLRAAAAIGRYDCGWLQAYKPLIAPLIQDVANYIRSSNAYPFLRNFSPYHGHSWADGTSHEAANQESTSESMNFAAGLMQLGQLAGDPQCRNAGLSSDWVAIGTYLYEQEIKAAEEYWFNQDAKLTPWAIAPLPGEVEYNGNWPQEFVNYMGPDGETVLHTTLIAVLWGNNLSRATFFGDVSTSYFIHGLPLGSSTLYLGRNQSWLNATWQQYLDDLEATGINPSGTINEAAITLFQALLPDKGKDINGTGLKPALLRIANPHKFQPYATNAMAKYWAYTNSLLGQVDDSILADTASYGVFRNAAGQRSFVAYNPGNKAIDVHFYDRGSNQISAMTALPPGVMMANTPGGTFSYAPSASPTPKSRLYLQKATGPAEGPLTGDLTNAPGTWLPTSEQYPFPSSNDNSKLADSLAVIPVSTGNCSAIDLPGGPNCKTSIQAYGNWTGTFSGKRVGAKDTTMTQLAIYMNPALHAGWQRDPTIGTTGYVRVVYDFNSDGKPDRIEVVWRGMNGDNTWVIGPHKFTHYYSTCYGDFPNNPPDVCSGTSGFYGVDNNNEHPSGIVVVDKRLNANADYPDTVKCGTVSVQVYGQAGSDPKTKVPMPVSVGVSPVLGRASWIQPPYNGGSCTP